MFTNETLLVANPAIIRMEGVSFDFDAKEDQPFLHDLHLLVTKGERVAIVGAEGSGKSTLLRLLAGLLPVQMGTIWFDGLTWAEMADTRRIALLGVLLQNPGQQLLTSQVEEEITLVPYAVGWPKDRVDMAMPEVLHWVGLDAHILSHSLWQLSPSQQVRVALASLLIMRPQIILLDEPGAALSTAGEHQLAELFSHLQNVWSLTTIVFTSRKERGERFASRLLYLQAGTLAAKSNDQV